MHRCVVSLLLLPCLLLTQSAALLGNAHAGLRLHGHDLRPHFHTQPVPDGHDYGHHSGLGVLHQYHQDDANDAIELDTQPTSQPEPLSDHDSDAVYVASVDAVLAERCAVHDGVDSLLPWAALAASHLAGWWPTPSRHPVNWWYTQPSGSSCPLYVWHLTLLI